MKLLLQMSHLLIILLSLITSTTSLNYSKPGCKDICGKVRIPYPFGIGASCSINKWYVVGCNSSKPYLSALKHLEVLNISLANRTVTVNATSSIYNCQNQGQNRRRQISSFDLDGSPFFLSQFSNKFVLKGCGNALIMDHGSVVAGCSTSCINSSSSVSERNNCFGINCCQSDFSYYLQSYNIILTSLEEGACGSAFLVDSKSYDEGSFSSISVDNPYVPISLLWTLTDNDDINDSSCCDEGYIRNTTLDLGNGTSVESFTCYITDPRYEGNPYLPFGCSINEVCASCKDESYCDYDWNDNGEEAVNFTCVDYKFESKSSQLGVILVCTRKTEL